MTRRVALIGAVLVALVAVMAAIVIKRDEGTNKSSAAFTRAIALDSGPNGRTLALVEDANHRPVVATVNDDGSLDRLADVPLDNPAAIAVDGRGAVVAGTRRVDGRLQPAVTRITGDGVDRDFATNGVATMPVGDGDAVARAVATGSADGIVLVADARGAMALMPIRPDGRSTGTQLVPGATAGGAAVGPDGRVLVAGTSIRDGSAVLARLGRDGRPDVTRVPSSLRNTTWRDIAVTENGGAVLVGSGRDDSGRSLVATQDFAAPDQPGATTAAAVGQGDAFGVAVAITADGRPLIGANGTENDGPAAYRMTPAGPRHAGPGRVAGITSEGGVLTGLWDGERQQAKFSAP